MRKVIERCHAPLTGWHLKLECGHWVIVKAAIGRFQKAKKCWTCLARKSKEQAAPAQAVSA